MNGEVNKAFAPNRASDLFPLVSAGDLGRGSLDTLIADALEIDPGQIVVRYLFLVNADKGRVWGATDEFISAPRRPDVRLHLAAGVHRPGQRERRDGVCVLR